MYQLKKRSRKLCNTVASFKYVKSAISSHFSYFGGFISHTSEVLTVKTYLIGIYF